MALGTSNARGFEIPSACLFKPIQTHFDYIRIVIERGTINSKFMIRPKTIDFSGAMAHVTWKDPRKKYAAKEKKHREHWYRERACSFEDNSFVLS